MPSSPACRLMPGAPQPARRAREGSRGTALSPARPAHTPGTGSSDKPLPGLVTTLRPRRPAGARSCQCPGQSWPFLDRCHPAAGAAAGPGGASAAKRGRTTWRRGKPTATLDHEEDQRPRIAGKTVAPGEHLVSLEQDRRNLLMTQRGSRSVSAKLTVPFRNGRSSRVARCRQGSVDRSG